MMQRWIKVDVGLPTHPKLTLLMRLTGVSRAQLVGHLTLLWAACADHAADGLFAEDLIEPACEWAGPPGELLEALKRVRFLDSDGSVHDWMEGSGEVLLEIEERAEEKRRRDREAKRAKREEEKRLALEAAGAAPSRDVSPGVAPSRAPSLDVAPSRGTERETESHAPPSFSGAIPDRSSARARDGVETPDAADAAAVERLVTGAMRAVGLDVPSQLAPRHVTRARGLLRVYRADEVVDLVRDAAAQSPRPAKKAVAKLWDPAYGDEHWERLQGLAARASPRWRERIDAIAKLRAEQAAQQGREELADRFLSSAGAQRAVEKLSHGRGDGPPGPAPPVS